MTDSHSLEGVPEPIPDWNKELAVWKWALPIHGYGFGIIFLAIAVYAVYNLVKLFQGQTRKSRNYFICITMLVFVFGLTRAIVLIVDPYYTRRPANLSPGVGLLLFSLGYPCLTSAFFLINWSLVEVTKLRLLPSLIHKRKVLALVLVVHFAVVVSFDTIFVHFPDTHILFICRAFFVLWGILLFGGFIIAATRIQRQVRKTLTSITRVHNTTALSSTTENKNTNNAIGSVGIATRASMSEHHRLEQARTRKVMKVARRAAATGFLICGTQIYALWEFYVFYNDDVIPKAWPWWIYQTCFRCIEVFMVCQMFLVVRPKN